MSRIKHLTVASAVVAFCTTPAFAEDSAAGETDKAPKVEAAAAAVPMSPVTALEIQSEIQSEVRGAVARGDMVLVEGPDGETYVNKFIPIEDLPDPTLSVRTVDTFTTEHRGVTFTNRVVAEN